MIKPDILLISGKSGSGKGTAGNLLNSLLSPLYNNVIQCSLSTYIRELCFNDFYWNGFDTPESRKLMAEIYRVGIEFYPYHMARRVWERDIMPYVGYATESIALIESFREKVNYDFFKKLQKKNLVDSIITLRINRPNYNVAGDELNQHASETDLDNFVFDIIVENNGTIEELKDKLQKQVKIYIKNIISNKVI